LQLVNDGVQAVEATVNWEFDLVLMDIEMPELNGFDATTQIRQLELRRRTLRRVPVMAYTTLDLSPSDHRFKTCGMDDVVPKPPEMGSMSQCLMHWCHGRHSPRERAPPD